MAPIVVLAVALMVACLGAATVGALQLKRAVSRFSGGAKAATERVRVLVAELTEGTTVTATEAAALQESLRGLQSVRRGEKRRRR
jgi:hypothetical protein